MSLHSARFPVGPFELGPTPGFVVPGFVVLGFVAPAFVVLGLVALAILPASALVAEESPGDRPAPTPAEVFALLAGMEGEWQATIGRLHSGETQQAAHRFRTASNDTVVMETMWPGGDHEMVNMYFMEGDDLVLTHYCSAGNQPRMRYAPGSSTAERLFFAFAGGTNLDPDVDPHIHEAEILLAERERGRVESHWHGYQAGEKISTQVYALERPSPEHTSPEHTP